MRMELFDLPPAYRAQAEKQLAQRARKKGDPLAAAASAARSTGRSFESRGEYEYYVGAILPKLATGEIKQCEQHPRFLLFPASEYGCVALREIRYTADFRLDYADGSVEIVEVKSKFVRRMQRDYHIRRRIFIETLARPAGWRLTEIITADSADEIKRWKQLAKERSE